MTQYLMKVFILCAQNVQYFVELSQMKHKSIYLYVVTSEKYYFRYLITALKLISFMQKKNHLSKSINVRDLHHRPAKSDFVDYSSSYRCFLFIIVN